MHILKSWWMRRRFFFSKIMPRLTIWRMIVTRGINMRLLCLYTFTFTMTGTCVPMQQIAICQIRWGWPFASYWLEAVCPFHNDCLKSLSGTYNPIETDCSKGGRGANEKIDLAKFWPLSRASSAWKYIQFCRTIRNISMTGSGKTRQLLLLHTLTFTMTGDCLTID